MKGFVALNEMCTSWAVLIADGQCAIAWHTLPVSLRRLEAHDSRRRRQMEYQTLVDVVVGAKSSEENHVKQLSLTGYQASYLANQFQMVLGTIERKSA